ncbi:MAG: glutathione synthase [Pirellulaceae bacterium]
MRSPKLTVIMDPIESIKPYKDSTLAMLLEAQSRGWSIHCGGLNDIWLRDGDAFGRLTAFHVADDSQKWFELGGVAETSLGEMDVILMRKDPPFDMEYIFATYVLERAEDRGALVVNGPQGLRDANEKAFVSWFPECVPPTLISRSLEQMHNFMEEHKKTVVKPLDLMGGQSVFVTDVGDGNHNVILETVTQRGQRYVMLQKYIPEIIDSGDKRIILIDGEPVPLALVRIPPRDDHRGNLATGARAEIRPLTDRDRWICEQIGPVLRNKGLLFAGIDVIGDFMTEINVTSPTGIRELERDSDVRIAEQIFDAISSRRDSMSPPRVKV